MKDHVVAPLNLEILLHILTDYFNLAIRTLPKLVNNQVRIVSTEVVKEDWYLKHDWPLQVALPMSDAKELTSDVVVVANFRSF